MDDQTNLRGDIMALPRAVARRLRIFQEWVGLKKQFEMARVLEISESRWNSYRKDQPRKAKPRDLPKEVAYKIHEVYPKISLEFLWLGEIDYMDLRTIHDLQAAAERIGEPFPEARAVLRRR